MQGFILDKYVAYIKEEKGLSKNTVDAYIRDLMQFKNYLEDNSGSNLLESNKTVIITYLSFLQKNGKAVSTISRNIASLRCLYQYLLNSNVISEDPTFNLKSPKSERKLPNVLSEDEINLLISHTNIDTEKGTRDKAMIQLIYCAGLRVTELIDISIEDFDEDIGILKLRDDNSRVLTLNKLAISSIKDYLARYRKDATGGDPLFVNLQGSKLSRQGVWKIFKQYNKKMDIDKDITPHVLRHSFALNMLNKGVSLIKIQNMMGHSDISTLQSYLMISDK